MISWKRWKYKTVIVNLPTNGQNRIEIVKKKFELYNFTETSNVSFPLGSQRPIDISKKCLMKISVKY